MKKIREGKTVIKLSGNGSLSNSNSETEFSNELDDIIMATN